MTRGAWQTTRTAALRPALITLLAALMFCLGYAAHDHSDPAAAPMATVSAATNSPGTPATHRTTTAAHPADCPAGNVCCRQTIDGAQAVLAAPAQPQPAVLSRMSSLTRPDTASRAAEPTPICRAPDLHILQVQRT